ncbi:unnamed protein product [Malus baccata var. baccata]
MAHWLEVMPIAGCSVRRGASGLVRSFLDYRWRNWLGRGCTAAAIAETMLPFTTMSFRKPSRFNLYLVIYASSRVVVLCLVESFYFLPCVHMGRNGRAFLFSHAMNITVGPKEDRQLMTGLHTVADVSCCDCHEVLGWKYERAYEQTQKYKEGKFILEKSKIVKENW